MLLAYLDESFSQGYYFMGGLILPPKLVPPIERIMNHLVQDVIIDHSFPSDFILELHGSQIWNGKGPWKNIGERYRFAVMIHAIEKICEHDVEIVFQGIDNKSHERKYQYPIPPRDLALKYLLEVIDRNIEKKETHGVVILDQTSDTRENSRQRKLFNEFQSLSTGGRFSRKLEFIVDTLHFVPSAESRLIQAIDLITYIHFRKNVTRHPEKTEGIVLEHIWNLIEKKLIANRTV
jgi:hypothetical protein